MAKWFRLGSRQGAAWNMVVLAFAAFLLLMDGGPARAGSEEDSIDFIWGETYAGIFAGYARLNNRLVDVDGTFGDLSADTNTLDPEGLDETAQVDFRWNVTTRAGVEQAVGRSTIFATGGLAIARIANSVTDIDFPPTCLDPDDSFRDSSTEVGCVIGAGVETPLSDTWTLRLEGSYMDFGLSTYSVNRSGNNACGPGNPRRPCPYNIEHKLGLVRLALINPFRW